MAPPLNHNENLSQTPLLVLSSYSPRDLNFGSKKLFQMLLGYVCEGGH